MKRIILILLVILAVGWISFSTFDLWLNKANKLAPEFVFCKADSTVLLINRTKELQKEDFFQLVQKNDLASKINLIDSVVPKNTRIYISGKRPIILLKGRGSWNKKVVADIKKSFSSEDVDVHTSNNFLLISKDEKVCAKDTLNSIFIEADKKASANYWVYKPQTTQWKRTDIYNLDRGLFRYTSSETTSHYGEPVKDIALFSSVIPYTISHYTFKERFLAFSQDSVLKNSPMGQWIDKGFVRIQYKNTPVLITDYRSQQLPQLVLKSIIHSDQQVKKIGNMFAFHGVQLTADFPHSKEDTFYVFEIENKAFFTTSKNNARKLMVDYQLGKTLALHPEQEKQFFKGLPSYVNYREVSSKRKMSVTWKNRLRFEVNTQPPKRRLENRNKKMWSYPINFSQPHIVTIYDHLRKGISSFIYGEHGKYELIGPNGARIWHGDLHTKIIGKVKIVDVFDNNKHQFLFRTQNKVFLIDLNRSAVGAFPYDNHGPLSSGISSFIWNEEKRFLVGTESGKIVMLNNAGELIRAFKVADYPIVKTPYALNVKGNLCAWMIDAEGNTYLKQLERKTKAEKLETFPTGYFAKYKGQVTRFYQKEGKVFYQKVELDDNKESPSNMLVKGSIYKYAYDYLIIKNKSGYVLFNYEGDVLQQIDFPFQHLGNIVYLSDKKNVIARDAVKNKVYIYNKKNEIMESYPKEGRKMVVGQYDKFGKVLYTYTMIGQSMICYKIFYK